MAFDPDKTPPDAFMTSKEKTIVHASLRTVIKMVVPFLPKVAVSIGAALVAWMMSTSHSDNNKAETDKKVNVGYGTLAPATNKQAEEIAQLKKDVAQLAESVALQARLALASRPGFDDKGKPETAPAAARRKRLGRVAAPPADPTIVKKVQEDAAKNQALKAKLAPAPAAPASPAPPAVPAALPAEVPKAPTAPAQKPTGQEWPPPVPVQPQDANP